MFKVLKRYVHWLHTQWPAGTVEKLPRVNPDYSTNIPGLYITGDLTGIPLLKFSADSGARVVHALMNDPGFARRDIDAADVLDLAIIGGGVSGFSAALEAAQAGIAFELYEASEPFSTIVNFPKGKPIYTYPPDMTPAGAMQFHESSNVKEGLLQDLQAQATAAGIKPILKRVDRIRRAGRIFELVMGDGAIVRAHRVIVAIGRSGNFRKLGVPGEDLDKVYNRLHDPADFAAQNVLVVGGGDSALEAAIALATCGCHVTLSYRKPDFSRPKPDNIAKITELRADIRAGVEVEEPTGDRVTTAVGDFMGASRRPGSLRLMMSSRVKQITDDTVEVTNADGEEETMANDAVFAMIGREPPLEFFRRSGVRITGEWTRASIFWLVIFMILMVWVYHWKSEKPLPLIGALPAEMNPQPGRLIAWWESAGGAFARAVQDPATLPGTLKISMSSPAFYYTLAYSIVVVIFGLRRIKRRQTPYVKVQTLTLMAIQCLPLFILPEVALPWAGHHGLFGQRQRVLRLDRPQQERWQLIEHTLESRRQALAAARSAEEAGDQAMDLMYRQLAADLMQRALASVAAMPELPESVESWQHRLEHSWPGLIVRDAQGRGELAINTAARRVYVTLDTESGSWLGDGLFPPVNYGHGREYWRAYGFVLAWPLFVYNWFTEEPLWAWLMIGVLQTFVIIPVLIRRWGKGAYCGWICSCGALAETLGDAHRHKMPHGPRWNRLNMLGQVILLGAILLMITRVLAWCDVAWARSAFEFGFKKMPLLNYAWFVDVLLAGILGYGLYFWYSGRIWCRLACPLAALMHLYARFSRFRILADKKKCISCNVCTSVCHQGIDIMSFANKGLPMEDPECVRCSACVQLCPTGVLQFGQVNRRTGQVITVDALKASLVHEAEQVR